MDEIVKKRKGGRPRKYPLAEGAVPNTPAQVSEVEAWEKEMEKPTPVDKGPIVIEVAQASEAKASGRIRDAVFQCPDGHNTQGMENEKIMCRICEKPTRLWVVYNEPQRKAAKI